MNQQPLKIKWKPTPKQIEALVRPEFEILYGGARGGGKTDAGMVWLLYNKDNPRYRALVIRKNAEDLRDWIDRAKLMYMGTGADFVGNPPEIRFPSGAIIRLGHLKDDDAYTKYQGHEYQNMLIEELTQIATERRYLMLIASCRSTVPGIPAQVFSTTNPGNIGHEWVFKRFVGITQPGTPYKDPVTGKSRIFISAKIDDNPHLMLADPTYVGFLEGLPPNLRKAWREGEWENYEVDGAYYAKQMQWLRQNKHITSVPYDGALLVDTWWDLGVNDLNSIWFTQSYRSEIRVIDFLQASGEGLPYYASELNRKGYNYGTHHMPFDITVKELGSGKTRYETALELGIKPIKIAPKLAIADGIEAVRQVLYRCYFDEEHCAEGLEALTNYRKEFDEKMQTFKNQPFHDLYSHGADGFRTLGVLMPRNVEEEQDPNQNWHEDVNDSW